ncbi:hypothetical protein ACJRO7_007441 [Eucalyptus globulus]|uniref:TFIIS N-terminal domain-containing protein n=1 Tax=Eucalyptus globulus TaxID=34317 RepID=A0ABD3INI1_EUCGL
MIAAMDRPRYFRLQRERIAKRLSSATTTQSRRPGCDDPPASHDGRDDCIRAGKGSKTIKDYSRGDVERDRVDMNPQSYLDCGGTKAFSDEFDRQSQVVREVLRIKKVLDNSQCESDSALYESLRKLQLMTISMDILEKTKIGITLNSLRRKDVSTQIAQLAHKITMRWKAMVEEICRSTEDNAVGNSYVDPCKLGEMDRADRPTSSVKNQNITQRYQQKRHKEAGSIANRNQRPNMDKHRATVKPDTSSSTNSMKNPASEIGTRKFEKERMLQNSKGITGCKRLFTSRQDKIDGSDEVAVEKKLRASDGKLQEHHQQTQTAKRQPTVLALPALPKRRARYKGLCSRERIEKTLRQMAKSHKESKRILGGWRSHRAGSHCFEHQSAEAECSCCSILHV